MTFKQLSKKQLQIFCWWLKDDYKALLCDGAIRSGKTVCMITSYIIWAMSNFKGCTFAICSKTVASCERNIITPMQGIADLKKLYKMTYRRSDHLLTVRTKEKQNFFYIFGGKDESSYTLIQGITLSGVLLDEVALMPRSFVEQAVARTLTEPRAKYWLNCNPENPEHFIKKEWVDDADGANVKRIMHLHFDLEDNPILTERDIEDAKKRFTGVFFERYILGHWVKAEGLVYPNFGKANIIPPFSKKYGKPIKWYVSIDYGTLNPCSMGLWAMIELPRGKTAIRVDEYYYSGRETGAQKTDEEYYTALKKLIGEREIDRIVIDPSAASFIALIRRKREFTVIPAKNDVIDGIRYTADLISGGQLLICNNCKDILKEFNLYVWDEKASEDKVVKTDDHAMDDMRYFAYTVFKTAAIAPTKRKKPRSISGYARGWNG